MSFDFKNNRAFVPTILTEESSEIDATNKFLFEQSQKHSRCSDSISKRTFDEQNDTSNINQFNGLADIS
jgi:hypothetical protein